LSPFAPRRNVSQIETHFDKWRNNGNMENQVLMPGISLQLFERLQTLFWAEGMTVYVRSLPFASPGSFAVCAAGTQKAPETFVSGDFPAPARKGRAVFTSQ